MQVKAKANPMATFSLFENVAGRLGVPRGNSRWFLLGLVWPAATTLVAAGHKYKSTKVQKYKAKQIPGSRLKSTTGTTRKLLIR